MESDDLEPRVSALEGQVRDLTARVHANQQDAAAARVLAGAADRDVGEIRVELRDFRRATSASFNAMRQDFNAMRQDFVDLRQDFAQGFAEMRGRFDGTAAGLQQIADQLQMVIDDRQARS